MCNGKCKIHIPRGRVIDRKSAPQHSVYSVGRVTVLSSRASAAKERLGVGVSDSVSACGVSLARAAVLELCARLYSPVYRDVVSGTPDTPYKTRVAAGLSLLPCGDTNVSRDSLVCVVQPAESSRRYRPVLEDHSAFRQRDIAGHF